MSKPSQHEHPQHLPAQGLQGVKASRVHHAAPTLAAHGMTRQRGIGWVGFAAGLALGLLVALGLAVWMSRAPLPFVDRMAKDATRDAAKGEVTRADPGAAPTPAQPSAMRDPNQSLYPKAPPSVVPPPPVQTPAQPPAGDSGLRPSTNTATVPPATNATAPVLPPPKADEVKSAYQLQAGAYRNQDDAEQMKAKLAMLGFEARVTQADRDGEVFHRVRVGPYTATDDLNKAKSRLAENGFEVTVVRIKP